MGNQWCKVCGVHMFHQDMIPSGPLYTCDECKHKEKETHTMPIAKVKVIIQGVTLDLSVEEATLLSMVIHRVAGDQRVGLPRTRLCSIGEHLESVLNEYCPEEFRAIMARVKITGSVTVEPVGKGEV